MKENTKYLDAYLKSLKNINLENAIESIIELLDLKDDNGEAYLQEEIYEYLEITPNMDCSTEFNLIHTLEFIFNDNNKEYILEYFNKILKEDEDNYFINTCKAFTYTLTKEYKKAKTEYDKILNKKELSYVLLIKGICYKDQYELEDEEKAYPVAIESLKKVLKHEKDNAMACYHLGEIYTYEDNEKSEKYLLKAKDLGYNETLVYFSLTYTYEADKKYYKALQSIDKILDIDTEDYIALGKKVEILIEIGDYKEALENLEKIPIEEDKIEYLSLYFKIQLNLKYHKDEEKTIKYIIDKYNLNLKELKSLKDELYDYDIAYQILSEKIYGFNDEDDIEELIDLATAYYINDKNKKAIKTINKVLKIEPENIEALELKGHCFMNEDEYVKAYQVFKKILELNPKNSEANNYMSLLKLGILEETIPNPPREMIKYLKKYN